jgi:signal transduction histidine kinase
MTSRTSRARAYLFSVAAAAVALLVTRLVSPVIEPDRSPIFLAAVIVSAWYGGLGPGLFATSIAVLAKAYFLLPPRGSLEIGDGATVLYLIVFVSVAVLVSSLTGALRRAEAQNHELAEAERAARLEAQSANRAKDVVLAKVSHELRTLLQATSTWAHLLGRSRHDDMAFDTAHAALQRSVAAQSALIGDLFTASRVIAGKMRLEIQSVKLRSVIEAAVGMAKAAARQPQPGVSVTIDPTTGAVAGDRARLEQVVSNLVSNALKFTPPDGRVDVRAEPSERGVRIVVADTGRGIAKETLPHLFDDFWQARAATAGTPAGLGLGLAIVRQLVELHGGHVHANSAGLGAGATFTVTLPVEDPAPHDQGSAPSGSPSADAPRAIAPAGGQNRS